MPDEPVNGGGQEPTTPNAAPWASDLASRFSDPEVQGQVDSYLRETWQPRVTQLEQKVAELEPAQEYYTDLTTNPGETWVALTHEILGDELAGKVLSALQDPGEPAEETPPAEGEQKSALSDEDRQLLAEIRSEKQNSAYHTAVNEFVDQANAAAKEAGEEEILKAKWFHPFVAAADGNLRQAYAGYAEWYADVKAGLAPATQEGAEEAAENNEPPPTLNSRTGGGSAPPVAKDYKGDLSAAIDDVFVDMQRAPKTVGSV